MTPLTAGDGQDTLIIEDSITNRGIFGDLNDAAVGAGVNSIDSGLYRRG